MFYTVGTAAKATGKSKPTITRAIKNGQISAIKEADGSYKIDPAELHRVYPPVSSDSSEERKMRQSATPEETALLRQENDFLKQQLERERDFSRELSSRLDQSEAERRETQGKLTALLTHHTKPEPVSEPPAQQTAQQGKGKLWEKLFGKMKM